MDQISKEFKKIKDHELSEGYTPDTYAFWLKDRRITFAVTETEKGLNIHSTTDLEFSQGKEGNSIGDFNTAEEVLKVIFNKQ